MAKDNKESGEVIMSFLKEAKTLADYTQSLASGSDWSVNDQDILEWLILQAEENEKLNKIISSLEKDVVGGCQSKMGLKQFHAGSKLVEVQIVLTDDVDDFCLHT